MASAASTGYQDDMKGGDSSSVATIQS